MFRGQGSIAVLFFFSILDVAWAADPKAIQQLSVENACTELERWTPETNNYAKYVQGRIAKKKAESTTASTTAVVKAEVDEATVLLRALALKASPKSKKPNPMGDALNDYWVAHAMYDLGLIFQAHHLFNEILITRDTERTAPFWNAALSCLSRIHERYPTLLLEKKAQKLIEEKIQGGTLSDEQKLPLYRSLFWSIKRENDAKELQRLAGVFKGEMFFQKSAAAIEAAKKGDSIEVLRQAAALNSPLFKQLPARERESWRLLFGLALFDVKQYDPAITLLRRVPNTSNDFIQALVGLSWTYLWQNKYEEAIGSSSNLILGELAKAFVPEGFETLSIALIETCNYTAMLETLQHFRKAYDKPHKYLEEMEAKKGSADFYQAVSSFLTGETKVPDRVGTAWISDPVFLANQAEINLEIDESALIARLRKLVPTLVVDPKLKPQKVAWAVVDKNLTLETSQFPGRKAQLIREIQTSLQARMEQMRASLSRVVDNLQLLEAEGYEAIGDRLIAQTGPAAAAKNTTPKAKQTKKNEPTTWDWGVYKGGTGDSSAEQGEIWYDELGYLKADLKKTCD